MPKGIAVTRITPRYSNPPNTWPTAGSGTEKPKLETDAESFSTLMPPQPPPKAVESHATPVPTAIATRPAGTPFQ